MISENCKYELCTGCGSCLQSCPMHCISMQEFKDGFLYPIIDSERCIHCNKCRSVCPINKEKSVNDEAEFFMGWHKDINVLTKSSSGGAFTAIASLVLEQGGIVYGAYFEEDTFSVKHISIENINDLDKLRLSKYYQSQIEEVYIEIKAILQTGREVLFSGTACQIAGLYSYLGGDYRNLITVDVLCHGVTNKKVVNAYIRSKEKRYKKTVKTFRFRLKPNDSDWLRRGKPE